MKHETRSSLLIVLSVNPGARQQGLTEIVRFTEKELIIS